MKFLIETDDLNIHDSLLRLVGDRGQVTLLTSYDYVVLTEPGPTPSDESDLKDVVLPQCKNYTVSVVHRIGAGVRIL